MSETKELQQDKKAIREERRKVDKQRSKEARAEKKKQKTERGEERSDELFSLPNVTSYCDAVLATPIEVYGEEVDVLSGVPESDLWDGPTLLGGVKELKDWTEENPQPSQNKSKKRKAPDLDSNLQYSNIKDEDTEHVPHAPNRKRRKIDQQLKEKAEERDRIKKMSDTEKASDEYRASKLESAATKAAHGRDNSDERVLKSKKNQEKSRAKKSKKDWAERDKRAKEDKVKRAEKKDENRKNKKLRGKKEFQKGGAKKAGEESKKRPGFEGRGKLINDVKKIKKVKNVGKK
ncbi:hypothetical protein AKO1_001285 [Acrasis kona]|uniref:Uncharacterized protein n=1 Tax=Acrasis kona TaxID=1008807 RepID=A0AAW2ZC42_9EUKA